MKRKPAYPPDGLFPRLVRLIHRSAWKGYSANFERRGFSEVVCPLPPALDCSAMRFGRCTRATLALCFASLALSGCSGEDEGTGRGGGVVEVGGGRGTADLC